MQLFDHTCLGVCSSSTFTLALKKAYGTLKDGQDNRLYHNPSFIANYAVGVHYRIAGYKILHQQLITYSIKLNTWARLQGYTLGTVLAPFRTNACFHAAVCFGVPCESITLRSHAPYYISFERES